ncbi:MAG: S9 family peptidase [Polyangiaceae bacterium]|nr:S9 family peptidase [Polyangiaceae bacterium]
MGGLLFLLVSACGAPTTEPTTPVASASATGTASAPATTAEPPKAPPPRADANLIKRQVLFGNPEKASVILSPDGKQISYLGPKDGVMNVFVAPADKPSEAKAVTAEKTRGIRTYFWAENSAHILYLQDSGGDENYHLYAVDLKSGEKKDLTPYDGIQARVSMLTPKHPDQVLISINNRDKKLHDLHLADLKTGKTELVMENPGYSGFVVDHDFVPRYATKNAPGGADEVYFVEKPKKAKDAKAKDPKAADPKAADPKAGDSKVVNAGPPPKLFTRIPYEDPLTTALIGFDASGKTLYAVDSRGRDTAALVTVDQKTGATKVVAEDPKADISEDVLVDPKTQAIQAVNSTYERRKWIATDKAVAGDLEALAKVTDGDFQVSSRSSDDKKWVVAYTVSDGPVRYYLYDRPSKKAEFLFTNRPELEKAKLAKMHPRVVKARDGLDLVTYVSVPPAADPDGDGVPDKALPTVLVVHGGPWARDFWGFNSTHQWLANRGYVAISVNYRGSTGLGKKFVNAANKEWAGKMHDDLIDVVNWAVEKKMANKSQVAIFGGSYGGYSTLVGLTFTPDTFACGVDIVGPSNLITLLNSIPPYWEPLIEQFTSRVGDHRTDEGKKLLLSRSPLGRVDKITKPLLIGQGANDPRVKQAESDQIVKAMQEKKIPVTYVLYPDEGHGFNRPENRTSFFAVAETFLAQCLTGPYEPVGNDFNGSSITVPAGAADVYGLSEALQSKPK